MSPLLAAAGLVVLIAAAHSYLGERYLVSRLLRRPDLPRLLGGTDFTKATLRFAWHITSVAWLGFALLLVQATAPGGLGASAVARITAATFGATGIIALVASRGRHLSWIVFLAIAALAALGA